MKAYQIQTAAGIDGLKLVDLPEPKLEVLLNSPLKTLGFV